MNKSVFEKLVKMQPKNLRQKYIFINDNKAICQAILTVGFNCLYISQRDDGYFCPESLSDFFRDKSNTGTYLMEYVFVLACFRKKTNDALEHACKTNQLEYKVGAYTLFKDKEYLGKYEYQDELEKSLTKYVNRYEGPDEVAVDKEQFIKRDPDGRERGIMEKKIVDYLIETVNFFVVSSVIYIYHDGVYREDVKGIRMKGMIQSLLFDRYINYRTVNAVYQLLIEQEEVQRQFDELNAYPDHWINFQNGLFDVKEGKMYKHHPRYLAINQIPHALNLEARDHMEEIGAETIQFLTQAIPDYKDQFMLYQYIGYCMTKDTCMQKFLIIKGPGGTGKSSIISVIQYIVGADNVSGISLQDLSQRFYPSQLRGKLLNACADISSDALQNVDVIKKATGEDLLMYERKGMDANTLFRSYAKLLFSANKIPLNLDEKSDALYRRMMILVMDRKPQKADLEMDAKLKREVDYLIWQAIGGLRILYQNGAFSESNSSREEVEKLHRAADTVKAFMDECTERQQGTDIKRETLYEKYCEYCKGYGRRPCGPSSFYRDIEDKGYIQKRRSNGRYVLDVSFKDDGFMELDGVETVPFQQKNDKPVTAK